MMYIVQSIPVYGDSMGIFGVFTTRRRAENALRRNGYKQCPSPDVWEPKKRDPFSTCMEIDEWPVNKWEGDE